MCGIAGIVRFDRPAETSKAAVKTMLRRMRHRGPDDSGVLVNSHAALGNARLSLVDRAHGAQPMTSPDGRWHLTYNGEVYNWRELRYELLHCWNFHSDCDTEVVLAALVIWGEAALCRFNGMFAFFLWDDESQTGFAARDRLGVKPFAFSSGDGIFAFSSEAKALADVFDSRSPNVKAVLEYLVAPYFSGVEQSMFKGIDYLQPGQCLRISHTGIELKTWWDWQFPAEWGSDEGHLAASLAQRLESGVQYALRADCPIGAFLSGGLDSTLLSSLAARNSADEFRTFTIQFQGQSEFDYSRSLIVRSDDTPHASEAASAIGCKHTIVSVTRNRLAADLRRLAQTNDALPAWEQELAQYHLASAVAEAGLRCVLVGDAADETHYGYPFLLDREAILSPAGILRRFGLPPLAREFAEANSLDALNEHYQALAEAAGHRWDTPPGGVLATTYLIIKRWLPRLLHNGDIHTMAFSVEARVPFADIEVLDLCRQIHPHLALRNGLEKTLLRQAARGLMPEANRLRPKSSLPKDQRISLVYQSETANALNESSDFLKHWLDLRSIRELCGPQRQLTELERSLLFRVICLHHWQQVYNIRQA